MIDLAKGVRRDSLKPALGLGCLAGAQFAWRIDRAGGAALDLREDVALGLIVAGEREAVSGRGGVVADAGQTRCFRCTAREQADKGGGASLPLGARSGCRFGNAAAEAGVADDVDVRGEL